MSRKWQHQILKRKNFAPTFVITVAMWIGTILIVVYTDPMAFGIIHLFFIFFFLSVFLTASILLVHTRRGFLIALGTTMYLFLRFIGTGSIVNFFLIALIFGLIELYFLYS
jgi:hypothetical protein